MKASNLLLTFVIIVTSLALSACGTTQMTVHYTPISAVDSLTNPGQAAPRIYVRRFADRRADQGNIGGNKNLYGMTINDVKTSDDLGVIIAGAATDALRKGNALADMHSEHAPNDAIPPGELHGYDAVIGGEILAVDVVSKPGWNTVDSQAHVVIRVSVMRNGTTAWIGPIDGTASQSMAGMGGLTTAMSEALDDAIQNCMRNMIDQLRASGALTRT